MILIVKWHWVVFKSIPSTQVGLKVQTRTTNVVRNAGCARSRYTLKFFLINELMNESINQLTEYI